MHDPVHELIIKPLGLIYIDARCWLVFGLYFSLVYEWGCRRFILVSGWPDTCWPFVTEVTCLSFIFLVYFGIYWFRLWESRQETLGGWDELDRGMTKHGFLLKAFTYTMCSTYQAWPFVIYLIFFLFLFLWSRHMMFTGASYCNSNVDYVCDFFNSMVQFYTLFFL